MHDRLFANQQALAVEKLPDHAAAVGLDAAKFKECLDSGKHATQIRKDLADGQKAGISGTPTFLLGLTDAKDTKTIKATKILKGAQGYSAFQAAIDELLSKN